MLSHLDNENRYTEGSNSYSYRLSEPQPYISHHSSLLTSSSYSTPLNYPSNTSFRDHHYIAASGAPSTFSHYAASASVLQSSSTYSF
jgi:hypothetical protein